MKFREWLQIDESRFKGLKRQFLQQFPNMPRYVANDLYSNRVGYMMRKMLDPENSGLAPTTPLGGSVSTTHSSYSSIPSKIFDNPALKDCRWMPKPVDLVLGPLDFDDWTLGIMLNRNFGYRPEQRIRHDQERMEFQRNALASNQKSSNEPVIIMKIGNKYRLLEGWHRVMAALVYENFPQLGAPPEHVEFMKTGGSLTKAELMNWKPVPIRAYLGVKLGYDSYNRRNSAA